MQQIINGLSLGSIYALLALGYTMVYGIIKLINFAHGDIYMLGAFWGYYAINYLHFSFVPALLSAMVMVAEFTANCGVNHCHWRFLFPRKWHVVSIRC